MAKLARHIGLQLCEAWGIDPDIVGRIVLDISPGDVAIATVSVYVEGETEELLLKLRPVEVDE